MGADAKKEVYLAFRGNSLKLISFLNFVIPGRPKGRPIV